MFDEMQSMWAAREKELVDKVDQVEAEATEEKQALVEGKKVSQEKDKKLKETELNHDN